PAPSAAPPIRSCSCRPPRSTPFPYTTLFRSSRSASDLEQERERAQRGARSGLSLRAAAARGRFRRKAGHRRLSFRVDGADAGDRSEEHTSELQSLRHLVCRLRLEKTSKRLTV